MSDVVVIGGGQAGLAAGYHLRRKKLDFVILDVQSPPGGDWQHISLASLGLHGVRGHRRHPHGR